MADFGIGEAAAAEGAKAAGEAATAGEALGAGTAGFASGAGGAGLGAGLAGAGAADAGLSAGTAAADAGLSAGTAADFFGAAPEVSFPAAGSGIAATAGTGEAGALLGGAPAFEFPAAGAVAQSTWDKALSVLNKYGPAASLGMNLYAQKQAGDLASKQYGTIAGPEKDVSNRLLQRYQSGQLSQGDQQHIAQQAAQQKAQINQYYARAGLTNSSMHQNALQQVDSWVQTATQQVLNNMLQQGLQAAGVSDPTLVRGVQAGVSSDAALGSALQNFFQQQGKTQVQQPSGQTGAPSGP